MKRDDEFEKDELLEKNPDTQESPLLPADGLSANPDDTIAEEEAARRALENYDRLLKSTGFFLIENIRQQIAEIKSRL